MQCCHLPSDVLVHLLSFIDRRDICNVMRVNKRWYNASKTKTFWKPHYTRALLEAISIMEAKEKLCLTKAMKRRIVSTFDPFVFREYKNRPDLLLRFCWRRQSYTWDLEVRFRRTNVYVCYISKLADRSNVTFGFIFNIDHVKAGSEEYKYPDPKSDPIDHGLSTCRRWSFVHGDPTIYMPLYNRRFVDGICKASVGICIAKNGTTFYGNLMVDKPIPHGKGKWTFIDGTTLTGNNVAFAGRPHGNGMIGEISYFAGQPITEALIPDESMRKKIKLSL